MTKFQCFKRRNLARSGLNRFYSITLKKKYYNKLTLFWLLGTRVYQYRKYERNRFFGCVRDFHDHI